MLNEGIMLTQMIVRALKKVHILKFYVIGWGLPLITVIIYTIVHSLPVYNESCWTKSMGYPELIYNLPPIASVLVSCRPYVVPIE